MFSKYILLFRMYICFRTYNNGYSDIWDEIEWCFLIIIYVLKILKSLGFQTYFWYSKIDNINKKKKQI